MNVANNNKLMNIIDMHVEKYAPVTEAGSSTGEKNYYPLSHIGCDETGSGDFFGPLCVVACYIDERDYDWLMSLNIRDPKLMTPQEVIDIAREIKDRLVYSLLILDNSHYNQMAAAGHNLANIKAKLYKAVTNVMQKVAMKIDKKVVNQFVSPKTYYNYLKNEVIVVKDLSFEQKGEEQYLAIMCSSILSKYAFYQYFNNMSRSLKMKLPRGNTSSVVDHVAITIAQKYGKKMLLKVTKTNMTNYKRIKDVI